MAQINVQDAKRNLCRLLERAEAGEEIVIAREGKPIARLVPIKSRTEPRKLGQFAGQIRIASDFEEVPPDLHAAFEGE